MVPIGTTARPRATYSSTGGVVGEASKGTTGGLYAPLWPDWPSANLRSSGQGFALSPELRRLRRRFGFAKLREGFAFASDSSQKTRLRLVKILAEMGEASPRVTRFGDAFDQRTPQVVTKVKPQPRDHKRRRIRSSLNDPMDASGDRQFGEDRQEKAARDPGFQVLLDAAMADATSARRKTLPERGAAAGATRGTTPH